MKTKVIFKNWIIDPSEELPLGVIEDTEDGMGICELTPRLASRYNARLIAAAPAMLNALEKAEKRIEQLCSTVNVLAGFRKVRADDFAEEVRAAIKAATG